MPATTFHDNCQEPAKKEEFSDNCDIQSHIKGIWPLLYNGNTTEMA